MCPAAEDHYVIPLRQRPIGVGRQHVTNTGNHVVADTMSGLSGCRPEATARSARTERTVLSQSRSLSVQLHEDSSRRHPFPSRLGLRPFPLTPTPMRGPRPSVYAILKPDRAPDAFQSRSASLCPPRACPPSRPAGREAWPTESCPPQCVVSSSWRQIVAPEDFFCPQWETHSQLLADRRSRRAIYD